MLFQPPFYSWALVITVPSSWAWQEWEERRQGIPEEGGTWPWALSPWLRPGWVNTGEKPLSRQDVHFWVHATHTLSRWCLISGVCQRVSLSLSLRVSQISTPFWAPASYCWSCQKVLNTLLKRAAHSPPPRLPISSQLAPALLSWTITSHPARKGPRLGLVETYYSLSNVVNISSLFSPQELL